MLELRILDKFNKPVFSEFLGFPKYYDNRDAVVMVMGDDWGLWTVMGQDKKEQAWDAFENAFDYFRAANIWFTPALVTQKGVSQSDWDNLQQRINNGYIEISAHSRTHPSLPYNDYESEITGCKNDIIANLDLPYKKGDKEYVYSWMRPYGQIDEKITQKLIENIFLADRANCAFISDSFANYGAPPFFNIIGSSVALDISNLEEANQRFDTVVNNGGIYSICFHPYNHDFSEGSWQIKHFDHIKGKNNLWYTGPGYLYLYHMAGYKELISVEAIK